MHLSHTQVGCVNMCQKCTLENHIRRDGCLFHCATLPPRLRMSRYSHKSGSANSWHAAFALSLIVGTHPPATPKKRSRTSRAPALIKTQPYVTNCECVHETLLAVCYATGIGQCDRGCWLVYQECEMQGWSYETRVK
jgi:hypothetical protein